MSNQQVKHQRGPRQDLGQKLSNLKSSIQVRKTSARAPVIRSAELWKADGEDHINVNRSGETAVGRALSVDSRVNLRHPIFDRFDTISGFWTYLRSEERDDRLRHLVGPAKRELERTLQLRRVVHIRAIVMDAIWEVVKQNDSVRRLVFDSSLPFDMYRVTEVGLRIRPPFHDWMIAGLEEIRSAVQQGRDPKLGFLKDGPTKDIFEDVRPKYMNEQPKVDKPAAEAPKSKPTPKREKAPRRAESMEMVPVYNSENSSMMVALQDAFGTSYRLHGADIETAPLAPNKEIDLLRISTVPQLIHEDIQSHGDIFPTRSLGRGSPHKTICRLTRVHFQSEEGVNFVINAGYKFTDKPLNMAGDFSVPHRGIDNQFGVVRTTLVRRKPSEIVEGSTLGSAVYEELLKNASAQVGGEPLQYVVFEVSTQFSYALDDKGHLNWIKLIGHVRVMGASRQDHRSGSGLDWEDNLDVTFHRPITGYKVSLPRMSPNFVARAPEEGTASEMGLTHARVEESPAPDEAFALNA